jgi:predicted aldo/keto reductase-like oxidoreductase
MQQVIENVATAEHSQPHNLTADEVKLIERIRDAYLAQGIPCTGCRYCMPCPNGVEIPRIFEAYNEGVMYNSASQQRRMYSDGRGFKGEQRADNCIKCEVCLDKCPQKLAIPELLEKAHAYLTEK